MRENFLFATQSTLDFHQESNLLYFICVPWPLCSFSQKMSKRPLCDAVVTDHPVASFEGNHFKTELKPKCVISAVSGLRGALQAQAGRHTWELVKTVVATCSGQGKGATRGCSWHPVVQP